jgi:hypothetical protein
MQRIIRRGDAVSFGVPERLAREQVDDTYFRLLPAGRSEITAEEGRRARACLWWGIGGRAAGLALRSRAQRKTPARVAVVVRRGRMLESEHTCRGGENSAALG